MEDTFDWGDQPAKMLAKVEQREELIKALCIDEGVPYETQVTAASARENREQWVYERHDFQPDGSGSWYLGASAIAAIIGVHPYQSALQVYSELVGDADRKEQTRIMLRGLKLEEYIAWQFEGKTGWGTKPLDMVKHPTNIRLAVNPDYATMHTMHGWIPLELKSHRWQMRSGYGEEWTDDIPLHEIVQCQWQMHLLGAKYCILAVMFGLDETDMQCYMVEYAEDIALGLEAQAVAFINNHILKFVPPEPTGSDADTEVIKRMYRHSSDKILQASVELDELCRQLKEIKKVTAADEDKEAELINKIKNAMGDEYSVLMSSVGKFTWKKAKDGSKTDWEKVAKAVNASSELIAEHTKVIEGSRRFLLPK